MQTVATTFASPIDKEEVSHCQDMLFSIVVLDIVSKFEHSVIEVELFTIGDAKQEAGSNRMSAKNRVIWTPSKLGTLAVWNE